MRFVSGLGGPGKKVFPKYPDFVLNLGPLLLHVGSPVAPFGTHVAPFWVHFGYILEVFHTFSLVWEGRLGCGNRIKHNMKVMIPWFWRPPTKL
jgi:hypothetical protein